MNSEHYVEYNKQQVDEILKLANAPKKEKSNKKWDDIVYYVLTVVFFGALIAAGIYIMSHIGTVGVTVLSIAALYFLPTVVGMKKRNAVAIFALNLLLGWTVWGWILALVWALTTDSEQK